MDQQVILELRIIHNPHEIERAVMILRNAAEELLAEYRNSLTMMFKYNLQKGENMDELRVIMEKFAACGWDLIDGPAKQWLEGKIDNAALIPVMKEADAQCGSCGCEFDPLYKRALELL